VEAEATLVGLILVAAACWLGDAAVGRGRLSDLLIVLGSAVFLLAVFLLIGLSIGSEISETSSKVIFGLLVLGIAAPIILRRRLRG
jgi:hypothetical protein